MYSCGLGVKSSPTGSFNWALVPAGSTVGKADCTNIRRWGLKRISCVCWSLRSYSLSPLPVCSLCFLASWMWVWCDLLAFWSRHPVFSVCSLDCHVVDWLLLPGISGWGHCRSVVSFQTQAELSLCWLVYYCYTSYRVSTAGHKWCQVWQLFN